MSILNMSVSGAVMIIAIMVIRALTINRLPKKTFLVLWGITLTRLLVPYSLPSAFSVYSLFGGLVSPAKTEPFGTGIPAIQPAAIPMPNADVVPSVTGVPAGPSSIFEPYLLIWLIGVLFFAAFFAVAYLKCRREFREALPVENRYALDWLNAHQLRRTIRLRQSDRISAPLTYGVFRPVILLPKQTDWNDETTLAYVLTHEFVHICRLDAVTKLVLAAALCLHWFNPAVWVMYVLANRDIELSCDEAVIRRFGEHTKALYAMTLILMVETRSGHRPLCNNFSKHAIQERIIAIMKTRKTTWITTISALALVFGVTTAFATSVQAQEKNDVQNPEDIDRKFNSQVDTIYGDSTLMSYTDLKDGKTYYSWDNGRTWTPLTVDELEAMNPSSQVEWWTAEEYRAWLEQEKIELQSIIGSQGWTPSTGWFTWTQERVDQTVAQHEAILKDIENGMMVSKSVYDENGNEAETMMSYDPQDIMTAHERRNVEPKEDAETIKYIQNEINAAMEQTEKELLPYLSFGLNYQFSLNDRYELRLTMTWQDRPVRRLFDAQRELFVANSLGNGGLGEDAVDLEAVYDSNGNLTGLEIAEN